MACKRAFYGAEDNTMELNFKAQKTGTICLVTFTSKVMVTKMSKMAHFFYFLLMAVKNQSHFGQNIQVHLKDLI